MNPWNRHADKPSLRIPEKQFLRAASQYVRSAYPNSDRKGCPDRTCLEIIARRTRRPTSEEVQHITTCSPCFIEYHAIRRQWKRRRVFAMAGLVAAVLLVAFVSVLLIFEHRNIRPFVPSEEKPTDIARSLPQKRLIDLRPYERDRGDQGDNGGAKLPSLVFDRAIIDLSVQLPVGVEEGRYLFEILDAPGNRRLEAPGQAMIINYITTAEVRFDLRLFSPGRFTLTVKRSDQSKLVSCPIEIH